MKLSIIIIGDEILLGQVTDTNSGEISRMLSPYGWLTVSVRTVADSYVAIEQAVNSALGEADLVITTGGLGPTKDDITKHVLSDIFGGKMVRDASIEANIERVFAKRHLKLNSLTRDQAIVPDTCKVIQNELGTAPIMWFERDDKVLISMPGVPFETVGMMQRKVINEINARFMPDVAMRHHTLMVTGITESDLAIRLTEFEDQLPQGLHLAYLPQAGFIRLRLDGMGIDKLALDREFDQAIDKLCQIVADKLLCNGDATLTEIALEKLRAKGLTLATAESCTGGNIAHAITGIAGCSDIYMGSVVSYSNDVKIKVLGVSPDDLEREGAVSEPVVLAMVKGVCSALGTDCSVATSGIAGPGGGTPEKPVGTVWIAARVGNQSVAKLYHLPGNRTRVIDRATNEALLMLINLL